MTNTTTRTTMDDKNNDRPGDGLNPRQAVIFDKIRVAAAEVAQQASHVHIRDEELAYFAGRLDMAIPSDPCFAPAEDPEATASFVLALDAVNFGSGYFPHMRKRPSMSGYHTVAACLRDHIADQGPINSAWLRNITAADVAVLFEQVPVNPTPPPNPTPPVNPIVELMSLFAFAWNRLGEFIDRVGGGTALGSVAAANGSASRLVELLGEIPCYRDVHRYRGMEVPFYKRAQITAHDLAVALGNEPPADFSDLSELTMFADNLVPHVLKMEGVLRFSAELTSRIAAGDDITSGSEPEVEIRACGLHAVEMLVAELARLGRPCSAAQVDGVLWRMGGTAAYKAAPRHRTRCTYY